MRELVGDVWPRVPARPRTPSCSSRAAARTRSASAGDGVRVLGEVESATAFFDRLSLLLFPLRRGSGMKVKTLEALASGVPVVTTAAGAEGIAPSDGVVVSEDAGELARAAAELLRGRGRAQAARSGGRGRRSREHYAPEPATRPLVELYERLAAG